MIVFLHYTSGREREGGGGRSEGKCTGADPHFGLDSRLKFDLTHHLAYVRLDHFLDHKGMRLQKKRNPLYK